MNIIIIIVRKSKILNVWYCKCEICCKLEKKIKIVRIFIGIKFL